MLQGGADRNDMGTSVAGPNMFLPAEVRDEILSRLDVQSLLQLSLSNTYWHSSVHNNEWLWKQLCIRYEITGTPTGTQGWKV